MGKRHEQMLLQRRHPDGQPSHEKMLHITHHQGNTNQNHNEIPPSQLSEWLTLTTQATRDVGVEAEKEDLLHSWWECKLVQPVWNSMEVPQRIKNRTTLQPSNCPGL